MSAEGKLPALNPALCGLAQESLEGVMRTLLSQRHRTIAELDYAPLILQHGYDTEERLQRLNEYKHERVGVRAGHIEDLLTAFFPTHDIQALMLPSPPFRGANLSANAGCSASPGDVDAPVTPVRDGIRRDSREGGLDDKGPGVTL
eukprot:TRINITY_DN49728_c0_g1_i1.p1 TRINITY_DN49728_c0_g1~~TRINITY_DN49728_c0_g1_i1.p1  ORF type:complete len:146 (-),score=22.05 TRINITY_DN49728_c0_g1_i1:121-558(-)